MVEYATAKDNCVEVIGDGYATSVQCKDIYKMKISDIVGNIISEMSPNFERRIDSRWLYRSYKDIYAKSIENGKQITLSEIKDEMEANGLLFDPILFVGDDDNG